MVEDTEPNNNHGFQGEYEKDSVSLVFCVKRWKNIRFSGESPSPYEGPFRF